MAEIAEELVIRVRAEVGDAIAQIQGIGSSSAGASQAASGLFDTMAGGAQKIFFMAQAAQQLAGAVKSFLGEAFEGEQAAFRLGFALESAGYKGQDVKAQFEDLSKTIQAQMGVADDAVQNTAAQLLNQGRSIEQTKKIIETANNMAAATGEDFQSLAGKIGLTYEGVDQRLSRIVPQIKGLTEEQMRSGVAADLLARKFAGAADQASKMASVRWEVNKEKINNLFEDVGNAAISAVDYFADSARAFVRDLKIIDAGMIDSALAMKKYTDEMDALKNTQLTTDTGQIIDRGAVENLIDNVTTLGNTWDDLRLSEKMKAQLAAVPRFAEWEAINQKIKTMFPDQKTITITMRIQAEAATAVDSAVAGFVDMVKKTAPPGRGGGNSTADWAAAVKAAQDMQREIFRIADELNRADTEINRFYAAINANSLDPMVRDFAALDSMITGAFTNARGVIDNALVDKMKVLIKDNKDFAQAASIVSAAAMKESGPQLLALQKTIDAMNKARNVISSGPKLDAFKNTDAGKLAGGMDPMALFIDSLATAAMQNEEFAKMINFVTETAGQVMAILAPMLSGILTPLLDTLGPLATSIAAILQVVVLLSPVFKVLGANVSIVAKGLLFLYNNVVRPIANGIIKLFNAIFSAIDAIPFVKFSYRIKELEKITFDQGDSAKQVTTAQEYLKTATEALNKEYDRQKTKVGDLYDAQVDSSKRLYELGLIGMQAYIDKIDSYAKQRDDALALLAAQFEPQLAALKSVEAAVTAGNKAVVAEILATGGSLSSILQTLGVATREASWSESDMGLRDTFKEYLTYFKNGINYVAYGGDLRTKQWYIDRLKELYAKYGMTYETPTKAPERSLPARASESPAPVVVNIYNSGSVIAEADLAKTVTAAIQRSTRRGIA